MKFFLKLQDADGDSGDVITNLKAQKLLYYAQGISLAKTGKPLFDEDFIAWQHGPVIPGLYDELKTFGRSQIELEDDLDLDKFSDEQIDLLISVYKTYGQFSAWKLRDMTHKPACDCGLGGLCPRNPIKDCSAGLKRMRIAEMILFPVNLS